MIQHHQQNETSECGHNYDLVRVEIEELGETPTLTSFQCPMCGEVVHQIEKTKEM